jgi:riboflavin-specific deaminase-like protein
MRDQGGKAVLPRPFVTANFAITADGRISTRSFSPSDFSSPGDKRQLLGIRAKCDAVLVGARTLAADRMTLGLPVEELRAARRKQGRPELPLRVILSNTGRIDPALRIFQKPGAPIVVFSTTAMPPNNRAKLAQKADLFLQQSRTVNLPLALATLREDYGVRTLVCEGGGTLFRGLLAAGLVDELHLTICPRVFAGRGAPTITGVAADFLPKGTRLRLVAMLPVGDECFTRWRILH